MIPNHGPHGFYYLCDTERDSQDMIVEKVREEFSGKERHAKHILYQEIQIRAEIYVKKDIVLTCQGHLIKLGAEIMIPLVNAYDGDGTLVRVNYLIFLSWWIRRLVVLADLGS